MKVWFAQEWAEAAAVFPFSHVFQRRLSAAVTALVEPSDLYVKKFGADFELMFRISAKSDLNVYELRGPSVYRKAKDVEYTVFLPFTSIMRTADAPRQAMNVLLDGAIEVLETLEISTLRLREGRVGIVEELCADPEMLHERSWVEEENNTEVRRVFEAFFGG